MLMTGDEDEVLPRFDDEDNTNTIKKVPSWEPPWPPP
jgi:hypothetical protein